MTLSFVRHRRPIVTGAIVLAAVVALGACTPARRGAIDPGGPTAAGGVASAADAGAGLGAQPASVARQLLRRGRMQVEVPRLAAAQTRLERATGALGGLVARVEVGATERAEYSLRVPAERLEALMDSAAMLGEVESRTVVVEDVTERVLDAEARLGALRASRDRLRQLLDRASTVQEVVAVERELARVQGELESLEARLQALRGQVAMSELSVRLRQRPVLGPLGVLFTAVGTGIAKLFVWR